MGTRLLTSLWKNTSTHIFDHIHEWRRCRRLVKAPIPNAVLVDWFTKYLLPKISCDVSMSGVVIEEDVIRRSQHLDLIYYEYGILYNIIPQDSCPSNDKSRPTPGPHANGLIGYVSSSTINQVARQLGQLDITDNPTPTTSTMTSTTSAQSTDVNLV